MTTSLAKTLRSALTAVGSNTQPTANGVQALMPTAKTRAALEMLSATTPEELQAKETNLRELLADLFNWSGVNKVNKALIREFNTAINTEGNYSRAVELTGFLSALSPMLEPDRLARIYSAAAQTNTVYAPMKYTLQLSALLKKTFSSFSEERIERLAHSLWIETHEGNWWSITLGPQKEAIEDYFEDVPVTPQEAVQLLAKEELHWSETAAQAIRESERDPELTALFKDYRMRYNNGEVVKTEPSLFSGYIEWLEITERPESPIFPLLQTFLRVAKTEGYVLPRRPRKFIEMFPPIDVQVLEAFPAPTFLQKTDFGLPETTTIRLITDAAQLAANAKHMGNCTLGLRSSMETGKIVLWYIKYGEQEINASMRIENGKLAISEINSRYNRGDVDETVYEALKKYASETIFNPDGIEMNTVKIIQEYSDKNMKLL